MKEFKNKVAAITGSATGIGRAFAEEAAKRGMRLALIDINTEGLEETKAHLREGRRTEGRHHQDRRHEV